MKKLRMLCVLILALTLCGCQVQSGTHGSNMADSATQKEQAEPPQTQEAESESESESESEPAPIDLHEYDFTLCFAGDISLEEGAVTTNTLDANGGDLSACISPELLTIMREADLMCLNNEFTYSTNGSPMSGKMYTFRAHPDRVAYLQEMGVDLVTLANNHVYDYGKQAILDTFDTLTGAGVKYFGAGRNLEEAMAPVYFELDGKRIAFVGASRAEKHKLTPQATDSEAGILRCYDPTLFLEAIREADANADFVIAVVHWGTERSTKLEEAQLTTGKQYLDAGADAIIGSHSHCLQGMEYYDNKPIVYSLGNYWFDSYREDTMLIQLRFFGNDEGGSVEMSLVPAVQVGGKTQIITDPAQTAKLFERLESISVNVDIDEYGNITEKTN